MNKIELPYFSDFDVLNLKEEYETEIEFEGNQIDIFLNEMTVMSESQLKIIKSTLINLSDSNKTNKKYISKEFENYESGSMTFDYLSFYLEDWEEYELDEIIDPNDTELNNLKKLQKHLKLKTISIYSDLIMFDYCLNDEISDQLLAVRVDYEKNYSIDWES